MLSLLLACSTPAPTPAPEAAPALRPVVIAHNWYPEPEFGGFYDAAARGVYRSAGLDVTILPGGPGAPGERDKGGRAR